MVISLENTPEHPSSHTLRNYIRKALLISANKPKMPKTNDFTKPKIFLIRLLSAFFFLRNYRYFLTISSSFLGSCLCP